MDYADKKLDKITRHVVTVPPADLKFDPRGIGRMYYDSMLNNSNKIGLIDGVTGNTITYKEMLHRAVRTSIALKNDDINHGDVIAIYCYHHLDSSTLLLAGLFRNVKVVGIDDKSPLEHVILILKQLKPKVVFVAEDVLQTLTEAIEQTSLITKIVTIDCVKTDYVSLTDYILPSVEEETFKPVNSKSLDEIALIFYTSGTTDVPKGVCRSHLSLMYPCYNMMSRNLNWDVILGFRSPSWTMYLYFFSISIFQGTACVVYKKFLPEHAWQFPRHKVTCMFLTVCEIMHMCHYGQPKDLNLSHLKEIIIGGSVLSLNKMSAIRRIFSDVKICNVFGQTEIGCVFLHKPSQLKNFDVNVEKSGCVGKGLPGISYMVVDLNSKRALGPNQRGELMIKAVYPLGSYYKADSSVMYDEDGWYKTGDLAYYDDDHCFYVIDRVKETFKFQHYVIVPSLIEDVLLRHPAVDMALVSGTTHDLDGEHPVGIVTLKEGFENITPKDLEQYVGEEVLDYQRLRGGVKIIDKFVMTASGKIDRHFVRNAICNGTI